MGRRRREEQPLESANQIVEELHRLRQQLTHEVGARKLLSTSRFAEELTARIKTERPTSTTTAWRWLEGRAQPSRMMLTRLRELSASLQHPVGSFEESRGARPAQIEDACQRTRIEIMAELLTIAPQVLREAEDLARSAADFLVVLSRSQSVTAEDASAALRKMVLAGLSPAEAAQFRPPLGEVSDGAMTPEQRAVLTAWHTLPQELVVKAALAVVIKAAGMRGVAG